jgi:K+-transporting ATPase KdpF subunit
MSALTVAGALLAVALMAYLFAVLLFPEDLS